MPVPAEPVPGTTLQLVFASNFRIKEEDSSAGHVQALQPWAECGIKETGTVPPNVLCPLSAAGGEVGAHGPGVEVLPFWGMQCCCRLMYIADCEILNPI